MNSENLTTLANYLIPLILVPLTTFIGITLARATAAGYRETRVVLADVQRAAHARLAPADYALLASFAKAVVRAAESWATNNPELKAAGQQKKTCAIGLFQQFLTTYGLTGVSAPVVETMIEDAWRGEFAATNKPLEANGSVG